MTFSILNKLRLLLLPLSLLYGLIIGLRNKMFDWKIFKSVKFELPIICVGNITVGGTGKTPHVEYLIDLLQKNYRVAVLSRGYKRKSKGFVLAKNDSSPLDIGDEPYQIYSKFKKLYVAVCENRVLGVQKLIKKKKKIEVVVLDDAFQHRYVTPGLSILLIDYNRPAFNDYLFPAGNLREGFSARKRAQILIVSKSPEIITNSQIDYWTNRLKLGPTQYLYFTTYEYGYLESVFEKKALYKSLGQLRKYNVQVLLVTGIANPKPLENKLDQQGIKYETLIFPDHHNYTQKDLQEIANVFKSMESKQKLLLTTEKDAVRFRYIGKYPKSIKKYSYFLPVKVRFLNDSTDEFNQLILKNVRKN